MNDEQTPALREAVENMATMREAYDNLSQAAEAYNTGKGELAANITAKGVQASADETLPELAEKVNAISQETYEINGGEMYAKQLFGSLETPNYWNLYDILAQLLSDGRLVSYGGILLAEYYRGYDSLALAGAGAGGAYVVSDLDENGQFKMYTEDTTHTWATEFDGKGNRWVAYCFADEYHDFQITDTNTSPRSIFIGRKVGTLSLLANARTSDIVVLDGNKLKTFIPGSYTMNWSKSVTLRNIGDITTRFFTGTSANESLYLQCDSIITPSGAPNGLSIINSSSLRNVIIECQEIDLRSSYGGVLVVTNQLGVTLIVKARSIKVGNQGVGALISNVLDGSEVVLLGLEEMSGPFEFRSGRVNRIYIGYETNDKTKTVNITFYVSYDEAITYIQDIELQEGWCKPFYAPQVKYLIKENVQAHIFDRLGVNDLSTGAVTITLANAVLNLFTQEEIDAVVERTNITIVGA